MIIFGQFDCYILFNCRHDKEGRKRCLEVCERWVLSSVVELDLFCLVKKYGCLTNENSLVR